jgi:hypothetical protein
VQSCIRLLLCTGTSVEYTCCSSERQRSVRVFEQLCNYWIKTHNKFRQRSFILTAVNNFCFVVLMSRLLVSNSSLYVLLSSPLLQIMLIALDFSFLVSFGSFMSQYALMSCSDAWLWAVCDSRFYENLKYTSLFGPEVAVFIFFAMYRRNSNLDVTDIVHYFIWCNCCCIKHSEDLFITYRNTT